MGRGREFLDACYRLASTEDVRRFYDERAREYDALLVEDIGYVAPERTVARVAGLLGGPDAAIADLGCGTGLVGEALARRGFVRVDGADYSAEMLAIARAKGVYRDVFELDLNDADTLPARVYDAALSVGAFSSAHIKVDSLDHVLGLVRAGGILAVTINERALHDMGFAAKFEDIARRGAAAVVALEEDDYHVNAGIRGWVCVMRRA